MVLQGDLAYARSDKQSASGDAGTEIRVEQGSASTSKKESIFEDVSIAQILAGALAAVTSMLFASQIGVAGSVIGVAVASVVATVTSQIYKRVLSKSADKIRDLRSSDEAGNSTPPNASEGATALLGHPVVADRGKTVGMGVSPVVSQTPRIGDDDASIGAELLRRRAEKRRKQKIQRRVIAVSIVSALVAVAVSVFLINVVTSGAGIGMKTAPIVSTAPQGQVVDTTSASDGNFSSDSASDEDSASTSSDPATTTPSTTTPSTGQDSSSSGTKDSTTSGTQGGSGTGSSTTGGSSSSPSTGTDGTSSTGTSGTGSSSGSTGSGSSSDTTKSGQQSSTPTGSSGSVSVSGTTSK